MATDQIFSYMGQTLIQPADLAVAEADEDVLVEVDASAARFPTDVSVYGVRGTGGNVREWTGTIGVGGRDQRVVRGGAWGIGRASSRCAYRDIYFREYVYDYIGFRVVAAARTAQ